MQCGTAGGDSSTTSRVKLFLLSWTNRRARKRGALTYRNSCILLKKKKNGAENVFHGLAIFVHSLSGSASRTRRRVWAFGIWARPVLQRPSAARLDRCQNSSEKGRTGSDRWSCLFSFLVFLKKNHFLLHAYVVSLFVRLLPSHTTTLASLLNT